MLIRRTHKEMAKAGRALLVAAAAAIITAAIVTSLVVGLFSWPAIASADATWAAPGLSVDLTHGPMLGDVGPRHAQVWGRTDGVATVTIEYGREGRALSTGTLAAITDADSDFTFTAVLRGLAPATAYEYRVVVDGVPSIARTFRTAPLVGDDAEQRIAFVSDAFGGTASTVWKAVASVAPHAYAKIGDLDHRNPKANTTNAEQYVKKVRAMHRELRGPETAFGRDFLAHIVEAEPGIPMLGRQLDDHDSGHNDVGATFPYWPENIKAFLEYHPIPLAPADHGFPAGLWQAFRRGNALFLFLDLRSQRVKGDLLGEEQKAWLMTYREECATVRWCVIVSTVPVNPRVPKLDAWHGFPEDYAWLLGQFGGLQNVIVVSGDCHFGSIVLPPKSPLRELNIPHANPGFANTCNSRDDQWTYNSSPAPGRHGPGFGLLTLRSDEAQLAVYNADGTLRFSTSAAEPGPRDNPPPTTGSIMDTFTREDNGGQTYGVGVAGYRCERSTGSGSYLKIIRQGAVLGRVAVPNPGRGVRFKFTIRCQVTVDHVTLTLNEGSPRAIVLSVPTAP